MQGNAKEMVQDCYKHSHANAPLDGTAVELPDCQNRVLRDGDRSSLPIYVRPGARSFTDSKRRFHPEVGFRLARTLP